MKAKRRVPDYKIISKHGGIACPRCDQPTQIREHINQKLLRRPHYEHWFVCINRKCKTTMIPSPKALKHSAKSAAIKTFDDLDPADPYPQLADVDRSSPPWE
jgi:hypothetical protein